MTSARIVLNNYDSTCFVIENESNVHWITYMGTKMFMLYTMDLHTNWNLFNTNIIMWLE